MDTRSDVYGHEIFPRIFVSQRLGDETREGTGKILVCIDRAMSARRKSIFCLETHPRRPQRSAGSRRRRSRSSYPRWFIRIWRRSNGKSGGSIDRADCVRQRKVRMISPRRQGHAHPGSRQARRQHVTLLHRGSIKSESGSGITSR